MKMPGKEKLSAALLLAMSAHLSAQDQGFQGGQQQFNQAGSVSVDMVTGEPVQAAPTTEILAIYRGPGYFDESLLDISASATAEAKPQPEADSPPPPPALDDWSSQADQQEVLPPPPVLPPSPSDPAAPQSQEDSFAPPPDPAMDASVPATDASVPPTVQENSQSMPSPQDGEPAAPSALPTQEGEPMPPPPMLEALPAFPQGE